MVLPEGTELSKTYLLFSVKDQSPVLGEGLLLGEALLPLADIVKEDGDVSLKVSVFFLFRLRSFGSSFKTYHLGVCCLLYRAVGRSENPGVPLVNKWA